MPRWWSWLPVQDNTPPQMYCPAGHRIPHDFAFHEAGYPRCKHRYEGKGRPECGKRLFVLITPRYWWVTEVSYEEIQHFTREGYDVPKILNALSSQQSPRAA